MGTQFLDTVGVADRLGVTPQTLRRKRLTGDGPPYYKVGRSVRYSLTDLETWLSARRISSTSETVPA